MRLSAATSLPKAGLVGQRNPYGTLQWRGKEVGRTRVVKNTTNPVWDEGEDDSAHTLPLEAEDGGDGEDGGDSEGGSGLALTVHVMDKNLVGKDGILLDMNVDVEVLLDLSVFAHGNTQPVLPAIAPASVGAAAAGTDTADTKRTSAKGDVGSTTSPAAVGEGDSLETKTGEQPPMYSSSSSSSSSSASSSPTAVVCVGSTKMRIGLSCQRSDDRAPKAVAKRVFDYIHGALGGDQGDAIRIPSLFSGLSSDKPLRQMVRAAGSMPMLLHPRRWRSGLLNDCTTAEPGAMTLPEFVLFCTIEGGALDQAQEDSRPAHVAVRVVKAAGLPNADFLGKSDPYCCVEWHGVQLGKTPHIDDTLNPIWPAAPSTFMIPIKAEGAGTGLKSVGGNAGVHELGRLERQEAVEAVAAANAASQQQGIRFTILDYDVVGSDEVLGMADIVAADVLLKAQRASDMEAASDTGGAALQEITLTLRQPMKRKRGGLFRKSGKSAGGQEAEGKTAAGATAGSGGQGSKKERSAATAIQSSFRGGKGRTAADKKRGGKPRKPGFRLFGKSKREKKAAAAVDARLHARFNAMAANKPGSGHKDEPLPTAGKKSKGTVKGKGKTDGRPAVALKKGSRRGTVNVTLECIDADTVASVLYDLFEVVDPKCTDVVRKQRLLHCTRTHGGLRRILRRSKVAWPLYKPMYWSDALADFGDGDEMGRVTRDGMERFFGSTVAQTAFNAAKRDRMTLRAVYDALVVRYRKEEGPGWEGEVGKRMKKERKKTRKKKKGGGLFNRKGRSGKDGAPDRETLLLDLKHTDVFGAVGDLLHESDLSEITDVWLWPSQARDLAASDDSGGDDDSGEDDAEDDMKLIPTSSSTGVRAGSAVVVNVLSAFDLRNADGMLGKSDPFVELTWRGAVVGKTAVVNNDLNPTWSKERFVLPIGDVHDLARLRGEGVVLEVAVMDHDAVR